MAVAFSFRVLIVHSDPQQERSLAESIAQWPGYHVFAAQLPTVTETSVEDWCKQLQEKVRTHRCHVVLIDRSCVNKRLDLAKLKKDLRPVHCVLYVGTTVGTERAMHTFLDGILLAPSLCAPRNLSLDRLLQRAMLRTRAPSLVIRGRRYLQEAADVIEVSPDEIEELLGYLFPAAKEVEIEPLRRDSPYSSVPRGRSALLTVSIDHRVEKLLKIAPSHKVKREIENYEQFVHDRLKGIRHAVLTQHEALWNIGGLVYSLIGTGKELPPTFSKYYESHQGATDNENQDPQRKVQIEHVLSELFDSWSFHYAGHFVAPKLTDEPLFAQYNEAWSRKLERKLEDLRNKPLALPTAFGFLPHPVEWVARHYTQSNTKGMRKAITHGDLHGENILVDWDGHCWLLDFERTGMGPILQDFTELETDIITRLTHASHEEFFRLCLLMCAPAAPTTSVSSYLKEYEEKYGGFLVPSITTPWANTMIALDALAEKHAAYQDRRERLWGILLNTIYAMSLKPDQERLERLLILGGVVCRRLEGWDNYRAAPPWPSAEWENLLSTTKSTDLSSSNIGARLELRVRLANNVLTFELNGGKYIQKSLGQQSLRQKPEIILEGVYNKLSSLAKKKPESSTQADIETLADTGHNLYSEIFPEDLKREYETSLRQPVGHSLLIISDDPWIPLGGR